MYIGIVGRRLTKEKNFKTFNEEIINIIYKYNCIPICIVINEENEPAFEFDLVKPLIDNCSGFIFQGGNEITDFDKYLVRYLHKYNIPTLGICLGCQTMSEAFGGTLTKNEFFHMSQTKYVHNLEIKKNSKLYKIIKKSNIIVNSRHNYSIKKTNFDICASSDVIEAIEDKEKDFFIGIQWHPESIEDKNSENLFNFFFKIIKK